MRGNGAGMFHADFLHDPPRPLVHRHGASHHLVVTGGVKPPANKSSRALRCQSLAPILPPKPISDFGQFFALWVKAEPSDKPTVFFPTRRPHIRLCAPGHKEVGGVRIGVLVVDRTAIQKVHHLWITFQIDKVRTVIWAARTKNQVCCLQHGHFGTPITSIRDQTQLWGSWPVTRINGVRIPQLLGCVVGHRFRKRKSISVGLVKMRPSVTYVRRCGHAHKGQRRRGITLTG